MIWNLTPVVCSPKVIKICCSSKVSLVFMMFLFRDSFPLTFTSFFWKKQMKVGHLWNSPWAQIPYLQMAYWYKSPTWKLPVSPGLPDMPSSFQRCQAQKCGKPHLNGVPIPETFNGWKMTDLLGRLFFSRGSVGWRFKLSRLLYILYIYIYTSSYIPIEMKHGPWKISGWEVYDVYDPLLCKDVICFSASQVDSFRGMYMAKIEECTTLLGQYLSSSILIHWVSTCWKAHKLASLFWGIAPIPIQKKLTEAVVYLGGLTYFFDVLFLIELIQFDLILFNFTWVKTTT